MDHGKYWFALTFAIGLAGPAWPESAPHLPLQKLYVSDKTGAAMVVDTNTNRQIGKIALGSEVGNVQYDPESGHIFANVQNASELAEIDPATDRVVGRYPLPGAKGNHGLLIEPARRLAFIACEDNAKLLVLGKNLAVDFGVRSAHTDRQHTNELRAGFTWNLQ